MANKKENTDVSVLSDAEEANRILEEARKEAEKIIAEAKEQAKKESKSALKSSDTSNDSGDDLVTVHLQKDNGRYKEDVFIAVNGERIQVQRGKPVKIKRKFAEVLEQSIDQDNHTAELIEKETSRYREAANLGAF